jgi:hypothetical protein
LVRCGISPVALVASFPTVAHRENQHKSLLLFVESYIGGLTEVDDEFSAPSGGSIQGATHLRVLQQGLESLADCLDCANSRFLIFLSEKVIVSSQVA